jgi:hypothetical protein
MNAYHNSSTAALNANISALLPPDLTNVPSLTQYLGVKDWYSMHYLRTCSGFYAPSSSNPSLLTSTQINRTCKRQSPGYSFSVHDALQQELDPSVKAFAEDVNTKSYSTMPWVGLWYIGIIAAGVVILLLPFTWEGVRRMNGYCALVSFVGFPFTFRLRSQISLLTNEHKISYVSFNIASGLSNATIIGARSLWSAGEPVVITSSSGYLGLAFSTLVLMIVCFVLTQTEWRFEIWTWKGERITLYRKPPLKSWLLMEALMKPEQIQGVTVGEEGIELS